MANFNTVQRMEEAIKAGSAASLRQLLDEDPARAAIALGDGLTPVLMALYHKQPELAEILQEHAGPLEWFSAAAVGDADRLAEHLSENPSVVNTHAADGNTALHLAAFFRHGDAVAALLDAGADSDAVAKNRSKVRPIHSAIAGGSIEVARQLLEAGAKPNTQQHGGWTAIQAAAHTGNLEMVRALLGHGADPHIPGDDGKTAFDFASEHPDVLALLDARKDH
ncbi:MAG: ankyrin repeat domain-containing protein [Planctomycetota bacterium]